MNRKLLKEGISKDVMLAFYGFNIKCRKVILVIMAVLMVVGSILPRNFNTVYADDNIVEESRINSQELTNYPSTTDDDFDASKVSINNEVISERTANTKTFRKKDGSYEVHYLKKEILT